MNKLTLTFNFNRLKKPLVCIDDKEILIKPDKNGLYSYTLTTESSYINLKIFNVHDLDGNLWFLTSYLFFVISLFGILDKKVDKKCQMIKYESTITLTENGRINYIVPRLENVTKGQVIVNSSVDEYVIDNSIYIDETLKKRCKIMKIVKALSWLFIIIGLPLLFFLITSF